MRAKLILQLASLAFAMSARADHIPLPHGPDIEAFAGACALGDGQGELGQVTKAGPYNKYCDSLTDAEICLAIIKSTIGKNGEQTGSYLSSPVKVEYCLEEFKKNLLGAQ